MKQNTHKPKLNRHAGELTDKEYLRHTGYPGGQRKATPRDLLAKKPERVLEMAVKGMLTSLDPHSAYLTDDGYSNLQESTEGQFTGLGIEIGYRGGFISIVTPIDGSPAEDAGLQAGDVILKIDGKVTSRRTG